MSQNPQHGTPAGDATIAIRKLARKTGADVQDLQTLYVLEALLARIAASDHRDDFVLKGGVLMAAFAARRPTKDGGGPVFHIHGQDCARLGERAGSDDRGEVHG